MNPQKPLPHPRALAHLGDAVYEVWIREAALVEHDNNQALHTFTTRRVNAVIQAELLQRMLPGLSEELKALVKRAQNMPVTSSRRSNQAVHRKATAFEALIGYWYLQEPDQIAYRKDEIFELLQEIFKAQSRVYPEENGI